MHLHALNKHETSWASPNKGRFFVSITSVSILPNWVRCASAVFNSKRECNPWKWKYGTQTDLKLLLCFSNFSSLITLLRVQSPPPKVQIILPQINGSFCFVKKYLFEGTSQFSKWHGYFWELLFFFDQSIHSKNWSLAVSSTIFSNSFWTQVCEMIFLFWSICCLWTDWWMCQKRWLLIFKNEAKKQEKHVCGK